MTNYNSTANFLEIIKSLEDRIRVLETSAKTSDPTTGGSASLVFNNLNGITIANGYLEVDQAGTFRFYDSTGSSFILYAGPSSDTGIVPKPDGTAQTIYRIGRDSAGRVLEVADRTGDGVYNQTWRMYDSNGNVIVSDAPVGLSSPFISYGSYPTSSTSWGSTTNTFYTTVYESYCTKQHPKITANIGLNADSGATVQAQMRTMNSSGIAVVHTTTPLTISSNGTDVSFSVDEFNLGDEFRVQLQIALAAGTGTVRGVIKGCWGHG